MSLRLGLILCSVLSGGLALPWVVQGADPPPISFQTVVGERFRIWDQNLDGLLTSEETSKLVLNPGIKGREAAAVAAIHVSFRRAGAPAGLSIFDLLQPSDKPAERRDVDDHKVHFAADYARFDRHVRELPRQIFTIAAAPALDGMAQGKLGDCYLVAVVGAAVHRDPKSVRDMFRIQLDGSNELLFPNGERLKVPALTDGEIMLGSSAENQGLWLNVLEKAYGQLRLRQQGAGPGPGELELDIIARGGDAQHTLSLLTGRDAQWIPFQPRTPRNSPPPSYTRRLALREQFRTQLIGALRRRQLVCVSTPKIRLPPGIIPGHDYALLDFDPLTNVAHLWNPWGVTYSFTPQGDHPGLEHGYEVRRGHFEMPFDDFIKVFNGIWCEAVEPPLPGGK
ncbi:MAG: hypothetical protein JSS02_03105 [Planctomycetes bacterium]|nr:hypothetical protein [Planctomycetota bacterium]